MLETELKKVKAEKDQAIADKKDAFNNLKLSNISCAISGSHH